MTTPTQDRSLGAYGYEADGTVGSYALISRLRVRRGGERVVGELHVDRFISALREGLEEDEAIERARRPQ